MYDMLLLELIVLFLIMLIRYADESSDSIMGTCTVVDVAYCTILRMFWLLPYDLGVYLRNVKIGLSVLFKRSCCYFFYFANC